MECIYIGLIITLINATSISLFFRKKIDETIILSMAFLSLIIYMFGLLNNLNLSIKIIEIISFVEVICILFTFIKSKEKNIIIKNIFTPGLIVYILLIIVSIYINFNRVFEDYDEFNHWAVMIKTMFTYNSFGINENAIIRFSEYPPFTGLVQYLFIGIKNIYREDIIIIAQNILYFSIMLPIARNIDWNKSLKNVLIIFPIILFMPMMFYPTFYYNILVDGLLGIMLAYLIFQLVEKEENINFKYIKIFIGLLMLSLTKTSGLALALLCTVVSVFRIFKEKDNKKEKKAITIVISIVIILISVWYIATNGQTKNWDFTKYTKISTFFDAQAINIWKKIINTLFTGKPASIRKIPIIYFIICSIFIEIIMLFYTKKKDFQRYKNYKYYSLFLLITIPLFIVAMYLSYTAIFNEIEASNLTSYVRYISTILLANYTFQIMFLIDTKESKLKTVFLIIIILITILFIPYKKLRSEYIYNSKYSTVYQKKIRKRNPAMKVAKYIDVLNKTDKILYITSEPMKNTYIIKEIQYEIMPIAIDKVTIEDYSSLEDFEQEISNYNYIFVKGLTDSAQQFIKSKFENEVIKNETLYWINKDNILVEKTI